MCASRRIATTAYASYLQTPARGFRRRVLKEFGILSLPPSPKERGPAWAWQSAAGLSRNIMVRSRLTAASAKVLRSPFCCRLATDDQSTPFRKRRLKRKISMPESIIGKILVVDDEIELMRALVEALSAQNFEVRGFTSGHEALEALRAESYDVMLSDLMMPEMSGIALVEAALQIDPFLVRSEEHTSELQSRLHFVCRLLL